MRLALLGDLMKERGRFEITDFWVISVCPPTNTAYLAPARHPLLGRNGGPGSPDRRELVGRRIPRAEIA